MNAHFLWTEAHSKRLKLRLTVQKEISGQVTLEQTFDVEFTEIYTQCDDCKKEFTPTPGRPRSRCGSGPSPRRRSCTWNS